MANPSFHGAILAGGRSSRMGQDKALLTRNGETLLQRTQRLLQEAGAGEVLISRNSGESGYIADSFVDSGPLGGIYSLLRHYRATLPLLVVPVDLPWLVPETLSCLVDSGMAHASSCCYDGHPLPLFLYQPIEMVEPLHRALIQRRSLSVRNFLAQFPLRYLQATAPETLLNTNTPAEWARASMECTGDFLTNER
ncbi:molybdenum cofactor guanylyltransferase [Ectothiorhodospiraceae bacterium BW-2]|nr:molybdenum cofactor guanylyltransferase [Ectothiorhodospiraceae bacterium BW-2]